MTTDAFGIDWSRFTWSESTVTCRCDRLFRSHVKVIMSTDGQRWGTAPTLRTVTRRPCPGCGSRTSVRQVSDDPEEFTL